MDDRSRRRQPCHLKFRESQSAAAEEPGGAMKNMQRRPEKLDIVPLQGSARSPRRFTATQ
jgi:hypothetical protein